MSPRHEKDTDAFSPHTDRTSGWIRGRRSADRPAGPALATQLRPLARRVHFLAGLLVAPFVLMLCLTGLVYVFSPQIHDDLYAAQFYVDEVRGAPQPVAEQVASAMAAHPEARLRSVVPPSEPGRTTRVAMTVTTPAAPGTARTVFVDPYTNYVRGEMITVDGRTPANVWLRELHSSMHLGEVGRLYSEIAASWLPVIAVGGLVVWIARQGRRRRTARELLVPAPRGSEPQSRLRAVHGPLGVWLTVGLLLMSGTGLAMSRFAGWGLPDARVPTPAMAPVGVPAGVEPIGVDQVLQVARTHGLQGELEVLVPAEPTRPFAVAERAPGLPVHRSTIAVDPYTATVTEEVGWSDYPLMAQVRELAVQLHTGTLLGPTNQIVLALLMVAIIVLILLGYRMWWSRTPYQATPVPALRHLTGPVGVAVLLATVVLGWLLPAFGISLVAFVVLDLVVRAVRHRQERARRAGIAGAVLVAGAMFGAVVLTGAPAPGGTDDPGAPGVLIHLPDRGPRESHGALGVPADPPPGPFGPRDRIPPPRAGAGGPGGPGTAAPGGVRTGGALAAADRANGPGAVDPDGVTSDGSSAAGVPADGAETPAAEVVPRTGPDAGPALAQPPAAEEPGAEPTAVEPTAVARAAGAPAGEPVAEVPAQRPGLVQQITTYVTTTLDNAISSLLGG